MYSVCYQIHLKDTNKKYDMNILGFRLMQWMEIHDVMNFVMNKIFHL